MLMAQNEAVTTLHAYANLVQIPVLVLSTSRQPLVPIAANRFGISIDDGPLFRATHVRLEGDDPISLSILLDVHGTDRDLLKKIDDAIAGLTPVSLLLGTMSRSMPWIAPWFALWTMSRRTMFDSRVRSMRRCNHGSVAGGVKTNMVVQVA